MCLLDHLTANLHLATTLLPDAAKVHHHVIGLKTGAAFDITTFCKGGSWGCVYHFAMFNLS